MSSKQSSLRQILRFAAVGGLNTTVDFIIFFLLYRYMNLYYVPAQIISYGAGVANSYFLNRCFTFQAAGKVNPREIFSFLVVNLLSLSVTVLLLWVLRGQWGWNALLSKGIVTVCGVGINFIGSKWVFGPGEQQYSS